MKALALAPNEARAHGALAWICSATNRPALGIAEAERSIALDRTSPARRNVSGACAAHGLGRGQSGRPAFGPMAAITKSMKARTLAAGKCRDGYSA